MRFLDNFLNVLLVKNIGKDFTILFILTWIFGKEVPWSEIERDPDLGIYLGDGVPETIILYYIVKAIIMAAFTIYYSKKGMKFAGL